MEQTPIETTGTDFSHSPQARREERTQLAADLEAFLSRGGTIDEVPRDFRADPPKKPESNYGRHSL